MLRTIAHIIFFCTGIFALVLIVLFVRSHNPGTTTPGLIDSNTRVLQTSSPQKALDRVTRAYRFHSTDQHDVFGAFVFQFDVDITVADRLRMYVFANDYAVIKKNLLLLGALYNFQETEDFFGKTFFLNEKNGDTQIIRFIIDVDGHAVGFEVLRDEYERLKALLLQ